MCLSIPSQVVAIDLANQSVTVDTFGIQRRASTQLLSEPLHLGDYVLLHIGFVMSKIDPQNALESLALYQSIIDEQKQAEQTMTQVSTIENEQVNE